MLGSPLITAILMGVIAAFSFGGGFAIGDWRMASRLERLSSDNALLKAANERCATDIQNAKTAVDSLVALAEARDRAAAESMQQAQPEAEQHTARVLKIRKLAPVPQDQQCEVIKTEQIAYVQSRH